MLLLIEPGPGIGPIYKLITGARHSVDLTMYELADPAAEADLAADAARGVDVRVLLDQHLEKSANTGAYDYLSAQLAAASGDIDAHAAVPAKDLRGAHRYGEIVKVLRVAGRVDDAEQWPRQGLAEHPWGPETDRLRNQLVDLLLDDGAGADAVARPPRDRRTADYSSGLPPLADLRQRHRRKTFFVAKLDKALVRH